MLTYSTIEFILKHAEECSSELLLSSGKYPCVDIHAAVKAIEARRKIKDKIPLWYAHPALEYPSSIAIEQCSSQATALYKQKFIETGYSILDITGGLGIDSYFFSLKGEKITYVERQQELLNVARDNFETLNAKNIFVINTDCEDFLEKSAKTKTKFDLIYADPARRDKSSKRIYSISDCEPDIISLKEVLFKISNFILVKISPMADVSKTLSLLAETKEVHILSVENECKELLLLMQKGYDNKAKNCKIVAAALKPKKTETQGIANELSICKTEYNCNLFEFIPEEEKNAEAIYASSVEKFLYQPDKALLKAGAFKIICSRYGVKKLAPSTHLYTSDELKENFTGKIFRVLQTMTFNKNTIKNISKRYPKANVTAINFPLNTNNLKQKINISDGGDTFIFGSKVGDDKILIIAERLIR